MILLYLCELAWLVSLVRCGIGSHDRINPNEHLPFIHQADQVVLTEDSRFSNRSYIQYSSDPVVSTGCGTFEGSSDGDGKNVQFDEFLGIRYAEPPVGNLRFKNPVPFGGYKQDKTYQTTEFCPPCMQPESAALMDSGMLPSEDCLCLNIYRPAGCDKGSKKPVLVYIHGSYYLVRSAARPVLRGGYLANYGDMIVVTMNYRLGAFGWLFGGEDSEIPGNVGFYDTLLAAEWVKQYIGDFGGDPNAITIAGHGSGATLSTSYLYAPNMPKDLFKAVMILSPDYNQADYVDPYWVAFRKSRDLSRLVGCGGETSGDPLKLDKETIDCLKNADAKLLADRSYTIPSDDGNGICAWNQLLPFWNKKYKSIDYRIENGLLLKGKRIYIGGVPTESSSSFEGSIAESRKDAEELIDAEIKPVIRNKSQKNLEEVYDWYLGGVEPSDTFTFGQRTTLALDDLCNVCPQVNLIAEIKKYEEVYFFYHVYIASPDKGSKRRKYSPFHGDDTPLNFGVPLRDRNKYNDYDRAVSLEIISIWSDFVHGRKMKWPPRSATADPLGYIVGDAKSNYYAPDAWVEICPRVDS